MLRSIRYFLIAVSLTLVVSTGASTHAVTWDLVRPGNTCIPGEEMRFIRFTPDGRMHMAPSLTGIEIWDWLP